MIVIIFCYLKMDYNDGWFYALWKNNEYWWMEFILELTYTIYEKINHLKTFYECHMG
jgi:hypothetical protein